MSGKKPPYWASREPKWFLERRGIGKGYENIMLYNLAEDPGQTQNLAATMPEKLEALRACREQIEKQGQRECNAPGQSKRDETE